MSEAPFTYDPTITKGPAWARHPYNNMMNVDDTSDANKPISDATTAALDDKIDVTDGVSMSSIGYASSNGTVQSVLTTLNSGTTWVHNKGFSLRLLDGATAPYNIQNNDGTQTYLSIDSTTTPGELVHGTNRQVNSQAIKVQGHHNATAVSVDCDVKQSVYVLTNTADKTVTISNSYKGKMLSLCNLSTTGRVFLPNIGINYKYGAVLVSTISSVVGKGLDAICVDDGTVLTWMVVDN